MSQSRLEIDLRGVVYPEQGQWIAHCRELDVGAQGETLDDAVAGMIELCEFQIQTALEDGDLESIFRPAPSRFWQLYFSANRRRKPARKSLTPPLNRIETREMVLA